ncbi:hypothetical protein [Tersicoccus sp. Bi-70]|uniref:hypothetical protein n=1 Tax=Tersicoccus sp. Bi-70 TaxID=1897634 RepID=UPI0009769D18|nr:hypothetical protein [Tersicoccus sp. Bi-70]OMH30621.1 hypothetical protein BGP79_11725 [Tersicoccus sp. Bi-70]
MSTDTHDQRASVPVPRIPSEDLPASWFFEARDLDTFARDRRQTPLGEKQRAFSSERYRLSIQAEKTARAVLHALQDLGVDDRAGVLAPSLERIRGQLDQLVRINDLLYRRAAEAADRHHEQVCSRLGVDTVHAAHEHEEGSGDAVPA